jgi:hypothetical protein
MNYSEHHEPQHVMQDAMSILNSMSNVSGLVIGLSGIIDGQEQVFTFNGIGSVSGLGLADLIKEDIFRNIQGGEE